MEKKIITIEILGQECKIVANTPQEEERIHKTTQLIQTEIETMLKSTGASQVTALLYTALNLGDRLFREMERTENLRVQITEGAEQVSKMEKELHKRAKAKEAKKAKKEAALAQETLEQENLEQETLAQETLAQETLAQETLEQETLAQETLEQETEVPEPVQEEIPVPEETPEEKPDETAAEDTADHSSPLSPRESKLQAQLKEIAVGLQEESQSQEEETSPEQTKLPNY